MPYNNRGIYTNIKEVGAIIYACEGTKRDFNEKGYIKRRVSVVNSDPKIIQCFLSYLRTFNIDETILRARLFIHTDDNEKETKEYWSKITKIPISQFIKTQNRKSSTKQTNKLLHGSIEVRYDRAEIFKLIMKDIEDIYGYLV